ncbi:hypothetical protein NDU88_001942 [Pleurodeles waltl]|uniref:Uncharacterized protein n=1 Tax=Pleurodeles waltl TaxID=8319 RepID=A0AAV7T1C5_PLEWA|nr:hypothetical protein NDU88_001942 [Pleurodeles waltl]
MDLGVPRSTKIISSLYCTRDNSVDAEYKGCNETEDEADEYIFGPQKLLENDLLDEDLEQLSNSQKKAIRNALGGKMFNPAPIVYPRGSDWWPMDHVTLFIKFWIRKSLDKEMQNLLTTKCRSPFIDKN